MTREGIRRFTVNVLLIVGLFGFTQYTTGQVRAQSCRDLEAVREYVREQSDRSLETVPTLAYYKQHPDELADVLAQIRGQKEAFSPPREC